MLVAVQQLNELRREIHASTRGIGHPGFPFRRLAKQYINRDVDNQICGEGWGYLSPGLGRETRT